jgi:hypothetical protein
MSMYRSCPSRALSTSEFTGWDRGSLPQGGEPDWGQGTCRGAGRVVTRSTTCFSKGIGWFQPILFRRGRPPAVEISGPALPGHASVWMFGTGRILIAGVTVLVAQYPFMTEGLLGPSSNLEGEGVVYNPETGTSCAPHRCGHGLRTYATRTYGHAGQHRPGRWRASHR